MRVVLSHHLSRDRKGGFSKLAADAWQLDVSVAAVDFCLEFRAQVYWMAGRLDFEIRRIGGALYAKSSGRAGKAALRGESPGYAAQRAEFGICKRIAARERSGGYIVGIPRSELAIHANASRRQRIIEGYMEGR